MRVDIDTSSLADVQNIMSEIRSGYPRVVSGAINDTLSTVKTQAVARIGNELNLKAARIKEDFTVQKASFTSLNGALIAKGAPVGLVNFDANQIDTGVTVKVLKGGSRKLLRHAYIGTGRRQSGNHVFWRGKDRATMPTPKRFAIGKKHRAPWPKFGPQFTKPVERLSGPRIEDFLAKPSIFDPVSIQANYVFAQNVEKMIDEVLRRFG